MAFVIMRDPITNQDEDLRMQCRLGCGACCIAPSITTPIPGMPLGKPAGVRCVQLNDENLCLLFGNPSRPEVCFKFKADVDVCGSNDIEALSNITYLEESTLIEVSTKWS